MALRIEIAYDHSLATSLAPEQAVFQSCSDWGSVVVVARVATEVLGVVVLGGLVLGGLVVEFSASFCSISASFSSRALTSAEFSEEHALLRSIIKTSDKTDSKTLRAFISNWLLPLISTSSFLPYIKSMSGLVEMSTGKPSTKNCMKTVILLLFRREPK